MSTANGNGRRGILESVGAIVRYPAERIALAEEQARHSRLSIEASNATLEEIVRRVQPEDDELDSMMLGSRDRELDPETSADLQSRAVEASYRNGHCVGYLRSLNRFVLGKGPVFREVGVTDEQQAKIDKVWSEFAEANDWDAMEDELPRRLWRDGEYFMREFVHEFEGPPANWEPSDAALRSLIGRRVPFHLADYAPPSQPAGMTFFRFIPVDQIADPEGSISHGILTAADDVCTVLGYCWSPRDGNGTAKLREVIPAREVRHRKIRVDQDVKRGRSILEPLLKRAKQYEQWLEYRLILNLARTAVVLFKKVTGSTAQVTATRDANATDRESTNDRRSKMLKPATTITHTPNIEYEFKAPNINAPDAKDDGRTLQLAMGVPTGLPEYMFTGDASNSNFASTMVAESPAVREFEDWQDTLTADYAWVRRRVLRNRAKYDPDALGMSAEEVDALEIEVEFPPMIARDIEKHAKADETLNRIGSKSAETIATERGLDWDEERARIRKEREDTIEFAALALGGGDGSDEGGDDE